MADASSIAPTGYQVVGTGAGSQTNDPKWLRLLSTGLDAYVDIETAKVAGSVPDGGDIVTATRQNDPGGSGGPSGRNGNGNGNGVGAILAGFSSTQWMLAGVAGMLGYGLWAGWFR